MARPVKLLGHRQTRRSGTHDSYFFFGPYQGRLRLDPTLIESPVGNLFFDVFNRHRIVVDVKDTGCFARGRADPSGELRKVIGRMQNPKSRLPVPQEYLMVKIRNNIAQWAAHVTKRHRAVHAPAALSLGFIFRPALIEFPIVALSLCNRTPLGRVAFGLKET